MYHADCTHHRQSQSYHKSQPRGDNGENNPIIFTEKESNKHRMGAAEASETVLLSVRKT